MSDHPASCDHRHKPGLTRQNTVTTRRQRVGTRAPPLLPAFPQLKSESSDSMCPSTAEPGTQNVAKTIVPSMISGHRYDDQPGHADIAAKSRSDSKDNTKLTVAIPAVSQTA